MPALPFPSPRLLLLSATICAAAGFSRPAAAQPSQPVDHATCAACTSPSVCAEIRGSGANSCTVVAGKGCQMDLSLCIIAMDRATRDLGVRREEMLMIDTAEGKLALAPVGDGRYAAWNCAGGLKQLVQRMPDGRMRRLPVDRFAARYAYERVVAERGARARRA
ncbi:MAG TPA: hypothetical protein VFQ39_17150 [Longimicrobium sp.]|nr:hypothetical protein [Longimicrobium sp.]